MQPAVELGQDATLATNGPGGSPHGFDHRSSIDSLHDQVASVGAELLYCGDRVALVAEVLHGLSFMGQRASGT